MSRESAKTGAGSAARNPVEKPGLEALAPGDFRSATEFLAAEHRRQSALCDLLERICHNPRHGLGEVEMTALCDYLDRGFALHVQDEEEDFLPIVERRAAPEDNLRQLRSQLAREHEVDREIARSLAQEIACLGKHKAFRNPAKFLSDAWCFAEAHRRHIAWEDSVVLPCARNCLTASDHKRILESMAARRRA